MLKDWKQKANNFWEHEKKALAMQIHELEDRGMVYLVVFEQKYEDWEIKHHKSFDSHKKAEKYAKEIMTKI